MKWSTLAAVLVLVASCTTARPPSSPARTSPAPSAPPARVTLHTLTLALPAGGEGAIRLDALGGSHDVSGRIALADDLGAWAFAYTHLNISGAPLALAVSFQNRSASTVEVDWARSVLIDARGRSLRMIRRGVRLADRGSPGPPTVIPVGANFDDFLYPADGVSYTSGRYGGWYAEPFFERLGHGGGFGLLLGLRAGGESIERTFRFVASMR